MFVRVDVVLAVYWSRDEEEMFAQPMINEMDWFNSAAQMIPHWPSNASAEAVKTSWAHDWQSQSSEKLSLLLTRGQSTDRIVMIAQLSSRSIGLVVSIQLLR